VAESIKQFGMVQPIVVDKDNNVIIGHCRLLACKQLKMKEVPIVKLEDLTPEEANKLRLLDNKLNESEWNFELLAEDVPSLDFDGFDIDWGIPEVETTDEKEIIEDDVPEEAETRCKLGDLWQLGSHRLICGDATDVAVIDRLMDGVKADMVFTDPPYGIGIDGQKESKCANPKHNRKAHEFRGWDNTRPDKSVFDYILSLNIPSVIFGGNYFADMLPATRGWIYWSKGQDGLTMSDGELAWTNVDKPLRCVTVNRANLGKTVHPTQKPLKVVEFCLDYAGEGEVVLDLFGGSGSTLIACEQLNRTCYMMELDPHYCDVIIARWEKLSGGTAVKIEDV
jgi:site-specific DNA-methyltransferase (adenine-specific)